MDYRRLIVILILVLFIAYMNQTMREGLDTPTRTLADVRKDIDYLKSVGINEGSENDTMKRLIAERASLGGAPPISTPPYSNNPSALANVPTPSMSCAAENFSSF
jgi:hypothetical protein